MSRLAEKAECSGCSACAHICPKQCISMVEDNDGFLYPLVDEAACIDCGRCEKVCPALDSTKQSVPPKAYAAKANDEKIRLSSSSGGVFTLIAEGVLDEGGVVFGCAFNDRWEAEHICVEDKESLAKLRGSKYIQSRIGDTFFEAEKFLRNDRKVLFSGTPCQIAGLKKYLGKDYENLVTVEVICHGVPSPKVWRLYLDGLFRTECGAGKNSDLSLNKMPDIQAISFRDKYDGWKKFGFKVRLSAFEAAKNTVSKSVEFKECFTENTFFRLFLDNVTLRPSCYSCHSKSGRSGADITLGDFWGIENVLPDFDDDRGCSVLIVNSENGEKVLEGIDVEKVEVDLPVAVAGNPAYDHSVRPHINRAYFFSELHRCGSFSRAFERLYDESLIGKIRHKVFRMTGL
ncbi:MAG: Coenzyme F420 hydrogenase/dehydrogenase, beta subunit C-terminal domain [Candidatus Cryptobacteroides sp.]